MDCIEVDAARCNKDGLCVAVCPSGALAADADGGPVAADAEACIACGHCVAVCPRDALRLPHLPAEGTRPAVRSFPDPAAVDGLLRGRRSIRAYSDRPVSRETLAELVDVARYAPTAVNVQEVRWIVTADPQKVRELAGLIAAWAGESGNLPGYVAKYLARWNQGIDTFLRGAPALAVAHTADDAPWGAIDSAIALTFMELAAVSRGLGACWAGFLTRVAGLYAPMRQALGLPQGHTVRGGLMLGYPKFRYAAVPPRNPAGLTWI